MPDIKDLVVFESLRVHRINVEKNRVKSIYTLTDPGGLEKSIEFIYSYNDNFFDPYSGADINLASLMSAQVAINYGLFCRKLIFDGLYDNIDRQFIRDMIENTSREIYVNKFLFHNEFLLPPFDRPEIKRYKKYTAASIIFENTSFENKRVERYNGEKLVDHFTILSSGGKDSLLTYGIIKELYTPHPVFINESGRHWFTAHNAYNHFREHEPNTVKPWCNSDRLFNWMARQMPFIKPNFQNIRADMYPIRLWTVAVFIFGALPVALKRKTKNILVGNEYDSTQRFNYHGISHYNSLYDQSRYFDNALTRFYHRKGWDINQYSILRSLSEMLILKVLVKRYPDLQKLQVSCHAAHKQNDVMKPCGNCEKCRRIVGMLRSLNEDPGRCGYEPDQITRCLHKLESKSVKQIGSDARHLYHLLISMKLIADNKDTRRMAGRHPEIMQLRFDNERSMLRDIPLYIRKDLFNILSDYADGAVLMKDRKWHDYVLDDDIFSQPFFLDTYNEKQGK
jgi:hypothetical protein